MSDDSPKGVRVRVLDADLHPTNFVGVVTRVRRRPEGVVCEISGNQQRLVVPRRQIVEESHVRAFAPAVKTKGHNRGIDDVALTLDEGVHVDALDIGDPGDGVVVPFPLGVER